MKSVTFGFSALKNKKELVISSMTTFVSVQDYIICGVFFSFLWKDSTAIKMATLTL